MATENPPSEPGGRAGAPTRQPRRRKPAAGPPAEPAPPEGRDAARPPLTPAQQAALRRKLQQKFH